MNSMKRPTELKTPEFRVSYPSVFKPKLNTLSGKHEFIVDALFPKKGTDLAPFKAAMKAAIEALWGNQVPKKLRYPIKDGDEMDRPEYEGHWVISFKSSENYPPIVIGTKKGMDGKFERLTSEKEFYGGCYARATVNAYAYDTQANKGVSFGLGALQKLRDGDRFGGTFADPEDDFADIEDTNAEADNDMDWA